jgi:Tfp pilus assembly protein PilZ
MDIYSEKRANERIAYKVPISVEDLEDGFIYRARMVNYSKSGMYLETDVILDLGAEIYIGIEESPYILSSSISSSKSSQYFQAKIRWQKDLKGNLFNFGYGVAILSVGDAKSIQAKDFQAIQYLRKHPRKQYSKPVFFASEGRYYAGLIKNISRSGIFIKTKDNFTIGQLIKLVIPGTKIDKGVMLKVEVTRLGLTGIGVKYKNLLKRRDIIKDRGGSRSGTDRRKMFISEYYPEKRSGKDRRKGEDRRRLKYLKYRKAINLSGAFRDLN